MAERHEEKYLISYRQYAMLRSNAMRVLSPDVHGMSGSYQVTSLYYDDLQDTALSEKQEGLPIHTKFRIRTYDSSEALIRLERKVKKGIMTQKQSATVTQDQLPFLGLPQWNRERMSGAAAELAVQMEAAGMRPVVTVRYRRDAFHYPGTDLRLTFDTELEALAPEPDSLFCPDAVGVPVLDGNTVIMEIKYGSYVPAFIRSLTAVPCKQLSVSKYAWCRERFR